MELNGRGVNYYRVPEWGTNLASPLKSTKGPPLSTDIALLLSETAQYETSITPTLVFLMKGELRLSIIQHKFTKKPSLA